VNVDDVGVVHSVGRTRLAQHPGSEVCLTAEVGSNELHRDYSVDEHVASAVDDSHPAFPNACLEAVAAGDDLSQ
jgi:hypothetical protein